MKKIDTTKLRKGLEKAGIQTTVSAVTDWVSTGSYALDKVMSGRFGAGIPNRRSVVFWGQSGAGKTFLISNIAKNIQDKGYHLIYVDTEDAIDEDHLIRLGVSLEEDDFTPVRAYTIEQLAKSMSEIFSITEPQDKVGIIVDSLSMVESEKEAEDFTKRGEMKGDMGQNAKKLKLLMKNINREIGSNDRNAFFVASAHAYQNQNILNGEGLWIPSGGKGFQFIPSISVLLDKAKLKEDDGGVKKVSGVRIKAEVTKTRFTQPYQKVTLEVPYTTGLDPYDGLLDMAEDSGLVSRSGAWYSYDDNGETIKFQKSKFMEHVDKLFDFNSNEAIEEGDDYEHIEKEL